MGLLEDKNNLWNQDHWSEVTKPIWKQSNINSVIDVMGASSALSASRFGSLDHVTQALASSQGTWGAVSEIYKQLDMSGISGALSSMSSVLDSIYGPRSSLLDGLGSLAAQGQTISSVLGSNTALIDAATSLTQTFTLSESVVSKLGESVASQASVLNGLANSLDTAPLWGGVDSWVTRFGAGMPGSEFAVSGLLPSDLYPSLLADELLESAQAFEDEFGGTEVEESANEFLDNHAIMAEQVYGSPFLRTLTLRQRRMVAGYLAFVVYLVFVSVVIFGDSEYPEIMHTLELFGIKLAPLASGVAVYRSSKKLMDKTMADPDEA